MNRKVSVIKVILEEKEYKELLDLMNIFDNCYVEKEEVTCFSDIKKLIDYEIDLESLNRMEKKKICRQLKKSAEWLEGLNVAENIMGSFYDLFRT